MAYTKAWVETDPDGSAITISKLDDSDRDIKIAVRERLEGDVALTGVIEPGTWGATASPKKGAARFYTDAIANIGTLSRQDGRGFFSSDAGNSHPQVWAMFGAANREIAYLNRDGTRSLLGQLTVDFPFPTDLSMTRGIFVKLSTVASAYTVATAYGLNIQWQTLGAGSAVTNLKGLFIDDMTIGTNNWSIHTKAGKVDLNGLFVIDTDVRIGGAAGDGLLATGANAGFAMITRSAGAPTGAPAQASNHVSIHYDSTNHQIYIRFSGTWRKTVALT